MQNQKGVEFEKSIGRLDIYKNSYLTPHIFISENLIFIKGTIDSLIPLTSREDFSQRSAIFFSNVNESVSVQIESMINGPVWVFLGLQALEQGNDWDSSTVDVPKNSTITVHVRLPFLRKADTINLDIDGIDELETDAETEGWHDLGQVYLERGHHVITVQETSRFSIDGVLQKSVEKASKIWGELVFQKLSPTKYKVEITNAREPFYLVFSEQYDSRWKVFQGDINWFDALYTKPIADELHVHVNGYANAWYIEKTG